MTPQLAAVPPLLVIAGPTATGKTALAIDVALALQAGGIPAEVISADSRQVFRGLDIGTAKPTVTERRGVIHHGLDLVDPDEPFSIATFAAHVATVIPPLADAGGLAILAGGTGFYLRAIAGGLDTAALPSDPEIRARIEEQLTEHGIEAAAARLTRLAPTLAARIDLRNPRRVARGLEMAEIVGDMPLPRPKPYPGRIAWIGLDLEPATHRAWIATRAVAQFEAGLVEEAANLRHRFDPALPAFSAIGYREAWAILDGSLTREQGIEADAARNVGFARRQRTWFRKEPDIAWLDAAASPVEATLAAARAIVTSSRRDAPPRGRRDPRVS